MTKPRQSKEAVATKAAEAAATSSQQPAPQTAKRRPVHTIREGDVSASIWARETVVRGEPTTFYSLTLERSYKDRDGQWKYTRSFDADSLGKVMSLCQQAGEHLNALRDLGTSEAVD